MYLKITINNLRFPALFLVLAFGAFSYGAFKFAEPDNLPLAVEQAKEEREEDGLSKREPGLRFRHLQLEDENGYVPPDGLRKARKHIEQMKKAQEKLRGNQPDQIQEAGVFPESWSWLGPGNIGGRIRSILIHPTNANKMWVGSVSGGIWQTTDGGGSWSPVNDFMANLAVSTMVMHPTNSNIMYAGTGEGFGNGDAINGDGVFRSTDGGATWNQLPSTTEWGTVNRLAIAPDGNTILAARNSGVFRSINSGTSWTQTNGAQAYDIDFNPTDNNRAIFGGEGLAMYSEDGGQSWNSVVFDGSFFTGRVEIAYAPSNPVILYASVDILKGRVYRSIDGGEEFTAVHSTTEYLGKQGWYDNTVWVNPQDASFVIFGGVHLWRSTDGGNTLTQISDGSGSAHADHHIIVSHPSFNNTSNRTVFFGNDGGIYRAANVAAATVNSGWTELNNNLGITQFYGAAGNSTSGVIIGGTQDNGTLRYNGGTENFSFTAGADGGYCAADQTNPNYFYGETQNLGVFRSSDAGQSSVGISDGITDRPPPNGSCLCNFIAPLTLDPNNPNRLLAGGESLWRTNNARAAAPAWTSIKPPDSGNEISAIAVSPNDSDFILVGHNDGDVWLTTNGTNASPTWSTIDTNDLPNRFMTRLVIDTSHNPDWIYATFGGFSSDNIYVSKNLGASWTDVSGVGAFGLPSVPVRTLVFHPHDRNLLYVGTEVGIFTSRDGGANWDLPNGGPANVSVDELFWVGGDLIAATHGRGLYRASGGLYVDCNYNGVQIGSFSQPFKTVNAALNALTSYRPIWLKTCNYNEQINTSKKFELRSLGGSAKVGAP